MADLIKKVLTKLKRVIENTPKGDAAKIEGNEKIIDIVERIPELNNKIQAGQGLKILRPSQMLSGLPITLAQLEMILKNFKTKSGYNCILSAHQKN